MKHHPAATLLVLVLTASAAAAAPRPAAVRPLGDEVLASSPGSPAVTAPLPRWEDPLAATAFHVVDQQCLDGGFGWPHDTCTTTSPNIVGPILLGVLASYDQLGERVLLDAAQHGGDYAMAVEYDNGEARFGTFTALFLHRLSTTSGRPNYATHAATELFDALAAGTYGPDDVDTSAWIQAIEDFRTGAWVNLRPWEFQALVPAAQSLGSQVQVDLFVQAVLDGLATLDATDPASASHDIIGLAGGIFGLASAGLTSFPAISAPLHGGVDGVTTLAELVALLTSLQNPDGSWDWHSNLPAPGPSDGDVQTTAYAVLALVEADPLVTADLRQATIKGRDWMLTLQNVDGGVLEYLGGPENTEVEGEFLSAVEAVGSLIFVDGFESAGLGEWSAQR